MPHPEPSRLAMELLTAAWNATGNDPKLTPVVMTYAAYRWKERSRTFPGIAEAMADQWGGYSMEVAA